MHPVWFWDEEAPYALVTARPTPLKVRHLAAMPQVSCFYWDPAHDTVAIDATAAWLDGAAKRAAWDAVKAIDPPVGFDPAMIWPDGPGSDDCRFLRFDAHRVVVTPVGRVASASAPVGAAPRPHRREVAGGEAAWLAGSRPTCSCPAPLSPRAGGAAR